MRFITWTGQPRTTWTDYEDAELYARVSPRTLDGVQRICLDIANFKRLSREENIRVDPTIRSTGFLRRLLKDVERKAFEIECDAIFIENVVNDWLPDWLDRNGYTRIDRESFLVEPIPSFYKIIEQDETCSETY